VYYLVGSEEQAAVMRQIDRDTGGSGHLPGTVIIIGSSEQEAQIAEAIATDGHLSLAGGKPMPQVFDLRVPSSVAVDAQEQAATTPSCGGEGFQPVTC
jgi:hypothetical protein